MKVNADALLKSDWWEGIIDMRQNTFSYDQVQRQILAPTLIKRFQLISLPYLSLRTFLGNMAVENPFIEFREENECDLIDACEWFRDGGYGADPAAVSRFCNSVETLQDNLRLQLVSGCKDPSVLEAGHYIIECINSRGYCPLSAGEISVLTGFPVRSVDNALSLIKTFEPRGIGASDLRECLLLQADPAFEGYQDVCRLLALPENLLQASPRTLARRLGISVAKTRTVLRYISSLNPLPGNGFSTGEFAGYIVPEIRVSVRGNRLEYAVQNGANLISVNETYYRKMLACADGDSRVVEYIKKKYSDAMELARELLLREHAVKQLVAYILDMQREYFVKPGGALKPVTMRMAAAAIGVHPSTVSRCVQGRYLQAPGGVIALKSLFSSGLKTGQGIEASPADVKRKIRAWIHEEDRREPLTDQAITERLADEGLKISRRTVAKYRGQLGIDDSKTRRWRGGAGIGHNG